MQSPDRRDWLLLKQYVKAGSPAAFDEIVKRHVKMVYGTCRREIGDPHLAEDVTQVVFLIFARKAKRMRPGTIVSRWLFKTAVFASRDIVRQERRREARESKAREHLSTIHVDPIADRPLETAVNAALSTLNATDWEAVHLRFYEGLSLREIGELWGTSEDTAQKRVSRAIARIRKTLTTHGIGLTAASIAALLTLETAKAATERCFETVIHLVTPQGIAAPVAGVAHLTKGVIRTMLIKNLATAAAVAVVGIAGSGVVIRSAASATGSVRSTASSPAPPRAPVVTGNNPTIVIDPGHGGDDNGGEFAGLREKDLDLAIALKVRDEFVARHWNVVMTRSGDEKPSVNQRAALAKSSGAKYFVSIHCDALATANAHEGLTIYYHGGRARDSLFAGSLGPAMGKTALYHSVRIESDSKRFSNGFGVLRMNTVSAVLIECGFMNNARDLAILNDSANQAKVARGIVDGVFNANANFFQPNILRQTRYTIRTK